MPSTPTHEVAIEAGDRATAPLRVIYVTASSYSGSTLLAFLLNTHPDIFTVGEMDGWNYGTRVFRCSCGEPLASCKFFQLIADTFRKHDLPFDFRSFGTGYHLVSNTTAAHKALNRLSLRGLPLVSDTRLERLRDGVIDRIPAVSRRLAEQDRANLTFIRTALAYRGARVFVDACKSPFRLRRLGRIRELDLRVLYLVRDPRGVALSNMTKRGWDASVAARAWVREQATILRIAGEFPFVLRVYYEDLCEAVNDTLAATHRFVGLDPWPVPRDFRRVEHHILGNRMRLQDGTIERDTRWHHELSGASLAAVAGVTSQFARRHPEHPLSEIIRHYLGNP
jgi:hypothetical protein